MKQYNPLDGLEDMLDEFHSDRHDTSPDLKENELSDRFVDAHDTTRWRHGSRHKAG
jgi:hypothetical protein